ncbi:GLUG motif-containing protein [Halomicroarcula sp. GCM10025709]
MTTDIVYGGGLVGETYGTIEDSYATGDVTADTYDAAGLAGSSTA